TPLEDQRNWNVDAIGRRRPQPLADVILPFVTAAHRLFLDDRALPRPHVVIDGRPWSRERGVEEAHDTTVVGRTPAGKRRVSDIGLLDNVNVTGCDVQHLEPLQPVRALAEHDVPFVHVRQVETYAGSLRHNFGPRIPAWAGH